MTPCRPGQVRNPRTNRCIKIGGETYRMLVQNGAIRDDAASQSSPAPVRAQAPIRPVYLRNNTIINPLTSRVIDIGGSVYNRLIRQGIILPVERDAQGNVIRDEPEESDLEQEIIIINRNAYDLSLIDDQIFSGSEEKEIVEEKTPLDVSLMMTPASQRAALFQKYEAECNRFRRAYFPQASRVILKAQKQRNLHLARFILFNIYLANYPELPIDERTFLQDLLFRQVPQRFVRGEPEPADGRCYDLLMAEEAAPQFFMITFIHRGTAYCYNFRTILKSMYDYGNEKLFFKCYNKNRTLNNYASKPSMGRLYVKIDLQFPLFVPFEEMLNVFYLWPQYPIVHLIEAPERMKYIANLALQTADFELISAEHCQDTGAKVIALPAYCQEDCSMSDTVRYEELTLPGNLVSSGLERYLL